MPNLPISDTLDIKYPDKQEIAAKRRMKNMERFIIEILPDIPGDLSALIVFC